MQNVCCTHSQNPERQGPSGRQQAAREEEQVGRRSPENIHLLDLCAPLAGSGLTAPPIAKCASRRCLNRTTCAYQNGVCFSLQCVTALRICLPGCITQARCEPFDRCHSLPPHNYIWSIHSDLLALVCACALTLLQSGSHGRLHRAVLHGGLHARRCQCLELQACCLVWSECHAARFETAHWASAPAPTEP